MPKVLLADPSNIIKKIVNVLLAEEGFTVQAVNNGDEAMASIKAGAPDIILAAIDNKEGMNGYALSEALKKSPATKNIPIILLTGAFIPFDPAKVQQSMANDTLLKPFEGKDLLEKIHAHMGAAPETSSAKPHEDIDITFDGEETEEAPAEEEMAVSAEVEAEVSDEEMFAVAEPEVEVEAEIEAEVSAEEEEVLEVSAAEDEDLWSAEVAPVEVEEEVAPPPPKPAPVAAKPAAPVAPARPVAPAASAKPVAPAAPAKPAAPAAAPARPAAPAAPARPAAPTAPAKRPDSWGDIPAKHAAAAAAPVAPAPAPAAPAAPVVAQMPAIQMPSEEKILAVIKEAAREAAAEAMMQAVENIDFRGVLRDTLAPDIKQTIEKILWEITPDLADKVLREKVQESMSAVNSILENVIWETVPELAESIIRKEIESIRQES